VIGKLACWYCVAKLCFVCVEEENVQEKKREKESSARMTRYAGYLMQLRCSPYNKIVGPIGPRHSVRNGPRTRSSRDVTGR
jgi:hypothetical protein